ncbi:Pyruvate kinase [Micractinium conductrix]|uniref:Pyruvate kinase n=1 Tax=Micractinium conductrix TaxID=554055 RepID=A0A2P6VGH9_9CHLO|nr:Pyruvate kinase [Micractinium conductrix]|eukprot:PSC73194.1 Pyruvate kinase [Micractinium conductrix]
MPLRHAPKAKAHVFLDVGMEDVLAPNPELGIRAGAGSKVVITVGPSCQDVPTLVRLLVAGVTCARIDLSWGTKEYHARSLANLSEAMQQARRLCSVWLDTTGREVVVRRPVEFDETGWPRQSGDQFTVEKDKVVRITTDPTALCSPAVLPVNYPGFPDMVEVGHILQVGRYLSTGAEGMSLYLQVVERDESTVTCVATNSATLDGLLTVMVCHTEDEDFRGDFGLPLLTEHDVDCMRQLGAQFEVDFVSLSFCNCAEDVYVARALLDSLCLQQTKIIAKIERKAAVRHFEGIAAAADGIIISRGNLGLDFEAEVMALLQKRIIARCNQLGKPVHVTRIVDTMVTTPRCTRAEATDVANAVLDGADGVCLGAETLRGQYPVLTVETVLKLCHAAERVFDFRTHHETLMGEAFEEEVSFARGDGSVADFSSYFATQRSPEPSLHRARARAFGQHGGTLDTPGTPANRSGTSEDGVPPVHPAIEGAPLTAPTACAGVGGPAPVGVGDGLSSRMGPAPHAAAPATPAEHGALPPLPPSGRMLRSRSSPGSRGFNGGGMAGGMSAEPSAYAGAGGAPAPPTTSAFGSLPQPVAGGSSQLQRMLQAQAPYMSKLESVASSATRTAEKINAGLIIVTVQTGRTVSLVAKYRPSIPIMAVVVPRLKASELGWRLEGKYLARQTLAMRGVVPMLAAPMSEGSEDLLSEAVHAAYMQRLVQPNDYVVVVMSHRGSMAVKVVQVNRAGTGLRAMSGANSSLVQGEAPDVISEASPFGAYMPPPSPMTARGRVTPSPGRTLSGRPSPVLGIGSAGPSPPALALGAGPFSPVLGGYGAHATPVGYFGATPVSPGQGHFLVPTASEAFGGLDLSGTDSGSPGGGAAAGGALLSGGTASWARGGAGAGGTGRVGSPPRAAGSVGQEVGGGPAANGLGTIEEQPAAEGGGGGGGDGA